MNNIVANGNVIFVFFNYNEYDEDDTKAEQDTKCTMTSNIFYNPTNKDLYNFIKNIDVAYGIDFRNINDVKCCNDYIKGSCLNYEETIQYLSIDINSNVGVYIKKDEKINKKMRIF
jgi:hypothetical protein